jgi:hypothetical protein
MKRIFGVLLAVLAIASPSMVRTMPAGAASPDVLVLSGAETYSGPRGLTTPTTNTVSGSFTAASAGSHVGLGTCNFSGTSTDSVAQGAQSGTMSCSGALGGVVASYVWVRVGVTVIIQWNPPPPPYNFAFVTVCIEVAESDPTGNLYRYQCVGAGA